MQADIIPERHDAHVLLDLLSPEKFTVVNHLLQVMVEQPAEPLARSLALAPYETEELKPEMVAELDHARASLRRGEGIPHEDILREFGLSQ